MKRFAIWASILLLLVPLAASAQQNSAEVRKQLAGALEGKDSAGVTDTALMLARMGAGLSDTSFDRIAPLLDAARIKAAHQPWIDNSKGSPVEALREWFHWNAGWMNAASRTDTAYAEVPAEFRLVEGIALDHKTGRLFVGTVIDGRLAYQDKDESWHEIPIGSPRAGLFGMGVDDTRRLLWIATASVEQTAVAGERMTGLIAVDLDQRKVVRRVPLGPGSTGAPGDLTIAADGTVYVSDAVSGAVHRCLPGCMVLEDWLPAGSWRNPQGMALADKDRLLYVADYSTGLWTVDTRTRRIRPVRTQKPAMLEGIDGLMAAPDGSLLAIQNGTSPRRIVRLYRTRDGAFGRVTRDYVSPDPRLIVPADGGEPTLGAVDGKFDMIFVADGQWERYGPGGAVKDGKPLRPTAIRMISTFDLVVTSQTR